MGEQTKALLIWGGIGLLMCCPIAVAALSPYMAGRGFSYIVGGMAGIIALAILLIQPLLASGYLPGIKNERRWHRIVGVFLVIAVLGHVFGLYLASPADMTDALLLVSPTPFSVYGVIGLWSVIFTAVLVALRGRLLFRPSLWKLAHNCLALIVVVSSVVHALMIEGTMGWNSKLILCICVLIVSLVVVVHVRIVRPALKKRSLRRT